MTKGQRQELLERAKQRAKVLETLRNDERYHHVMGRLRYENMIDAPGIQPRNFKLRIDDILWVGENIEPRVLELLPAILIKTPRLIYKDKIPKDLQQVKNKLLRGDTEGKFRDIPLESCYQWIPRLGRKDKLPSVRKIFYLSAQDDQILKSASKATKQPEAQIIRDALKKFLTKK